MKRIKIVAEIGCNHNGDVAIARKLIDEAKSCGVDAVKFQTFKARQLISRYAPKADYQKMTTGSDDTQLEMTERLELENHDYIQLKEYAESIGLIAFSTPFDLESVDFLHSIKQNVWKIPSGEITNLPYLEKIGGIKSEGKKIIVSTGMATIDEIRKCIDILVNAGTEKKEIRILHCNTEYPTPYQDVNILAIRDLMEKFPDISIGFSDHSVGSVAAIGATVLGISLIEKHFTLDKNMPGPDHKASATPIEMKELIQSVRRMERMLGNGQKIVTESERKNKVVARKSIVALCDIKAGEIFTDKNITCKRPGNGISPMRWYDILGQRAEQEFHIDELIQHSSFEFQE